jgi:hypothetical protein
MGKCLQGLIESSQNIEFYVMSNFKYRAILFFSLSFLSGSMDVCNFYRLKLCDPSLLRKSIASIFQLYVVTVCHILIILTIFQSFPLLLCLLWQTVICDI